MSMMAANLNVSASLEAQSAGKTAQMGNLRGQPNLNPAKVEKIAQDFEAVFIQQMLEHMFSGLKPNPVFGGGHGEEMFRSVLLDEYAKKMASTGGVGVAQHVKNTLLGLQEVTRS